MSSRQGQPRTGRSGGRCRTVGLVRSAKFLTAGGAGLLSGTGPCRDPPPL